MKVISLDKVLIGFGTALLMVAGIQGMKSTPQTSRVEIQNQITESVQASKVTAQNPKTRGPASVSDYSFRPTEVIEDNSDDLRQEDDAEYTMQFAYQGESDPDADYDFFFN